MCASEPDAFLILFIMLSSAFSVCAHNPRDFFMGGQDKKREENLDFFQVTP